MPSVLAELFLDLDKERLRVRQPKKSLFLCGGIIGGTNEAASLRDYIFRIRSIETDLPARVVLAEAANQLYRETAYGDLITFEEDIARIASIVLVIAESPGSLAELGAFASNPTIRKGLRVIVRDDHWTRESFIRYGPLERVHAQNSDHIGVYPWKIEQSGYLDVDQADRDYPAIAEFIRHQLEEVDKSIAFPKDLEAELFYTIYWIIYLGAAISFSSIFALAQELFPNLQQKVVKNKIYCMMVAGWIDKKTYSNKTYYFVCYDEDPFEYAFRRGITETDSSRRKLAVAESLLGAEKAPISVRELAYSRRAQP